MSVINDLLNQSLLYTAFSNNVASDNFYAYMNTFLSQRPEITYYQAQGYILQVDKFYEDLYNANGKLSTSQTNQYDKLMLAINSRVTSNAAEIVPVGISVPDSEVMTLPTFDNTLNKVEGYITLGLTMAAAGLGFYIFLKLKK